MHVANTERRICFKEVELKPKQSGIAQDAQTPTSVAKTSNLAKKVNTQMNHVMSGSAGPSRRGRGGRKRGSTKTQSKGKKRAENDTEQREVAMPNASESMDMDMSEG